MKLNPINFGFSATPSFCGLDPTKKTDITYMLSAAIMVELAFLHQNVDSDSVTNVTYMISVTYRCIYVNYCS
jgi:hypothetical protein